MPELPEIENIVQALQRLKGKKIEKLEILSGEVLRTSPRFLEKGLLENRFLAVRRKGKYILFQLEDSLTLVMHLGMTGQILLQQSTSFLSQGEGTRRVLDRADLPDKHTHFVIHCQESKLYYRDVRKFGFINLVRFHESDEDNYFRKIGYDPFEVKREFVISLLKNRKARIKPLLLSQKPLAGLGNIYVDETLFKAGIHPKHKTSRLSRARLGHFFDVMRLVLEEAIEKGGSSIDDYVRPDGSYGSFQNFHQVYGREGKPCPRCGALIRKIRLGGRGTSFCPRCQR